MLLSCAYALGLRVSDWCALRAEPIDSAADRMGVQGKGGRDRRVPLAGDSLARLRRCWQTCRPRQWLFGPRAGQPGALHVQLAQRWYGRARDAAGITKVGGIHSLRHGDATHLLKAGVDLYSLQQWLGHNHSRAARIAGSGAGAWSSTAALIARRLQRPGWPSVEVRRDAHARPHSVRTVGLRTQARALLASATPHQYAAPLRRDAPRRCRTGHTPASVSVCNRSATAQPGAAGTSIADTGR